MSTTNGPTGPKKLTPTWTKVIGGMAMGIAIPLLLMAGCVGCDSNKNGKEAKGEDKPVYRAKEVEQLRKFDRVKWENEKMLDDGNQSK